jgi:hypothetical protein
VPLAKRDSKCACGYPIVKGQEILFERHTGKWVHVECYKKAENEDQQKLF